MHFGDEVRAFLRAANDHGLRLLLVGGGAVNFHGYQRHSADIDLWIDPTPDNFAKLVDTLRSLGYDLDHLPDSVLRAEQNISIKISPDMEIELIHGSIPGARSGTPGHEAWHRNRRSNRSPCTVC